MRRVLVRRHRAAAQAAFLARHQVHRELQVDLRAAAAGVDHRQLARRSNPSARARSSGSCRRPRRRARSSASGDRGCGAPARRSRAWDLVRCRGSTGPACRRRCVRPMDARVVLQYNRALKIDALSRVTLSDLGAGSQGRMADHRLARNSSRLSFTPADRRHGKLHAHVGLGIGEPWLLASVDAPQVSQN